MKTNTLIPLPAVEASVQQCDTPDIGEIAITVLDLCGCEPGERHRFYELLAAVLSSMAQAESRQEAA